jgi:hypothetical protein
MIKAELRAICPRCRALPGDRCVTQNRTPAQEVHKARRTAPPGPLARKPVQVAERYGLLWKRTYGDSVWFCEGTPDQTVWWTIVYVEGIPLSLCTAEGTWKDRPRRPRVGFSTLDACFVHAALQWARRPLLAVFNRRARARLLELERRFGSEIE